MAKTTVRDIYRASLSILFEEEDNDPDFKRSFPFFLSKLLMEIFARMRTRCGVFRSARHLARKMYRSSQRSTIQRCRMTSAFCA